MNSAQLAELERMLNEGLARHAVPGAAVGLVLDDEEHFLTTGCTSVRAPVDVDTETLFQIGSTTKTVTASLVMRLVERGELDLDAPVKEYVPELRLADPDAEDRITLRHLLTHTGGQDGDLFEDFGPGTDALSRACSGMSVLPQLAPLGAMWSYSNAGFSIAGRAVEAVTGRSFEQASADLLLGPLGMEHSVFGASEAITHRVAVGHRTHSGRAEVTRPWELPRAANPAGGMVSSIADQLRYARFHLGDGTAASGERLLQADTMRLMQSPLVEAGGGRAVATGLSWLLQSTPGVLAHGGETNGQSSSFVIVPERKFAIVVATNADSGVAVHTALVRWSLRTICQMSQARPATTAAGPELAAEATGRYVARSEEVVVSKDADQVLLALSPTQLQRAAFPDAVDIPAAPVELYDGGGLRVTSGPLAGARGELLRDKSGRITWLRILGRIHARTTAGS